MQSTIATASSCGVVLGIGLFAEKVSAKIGRTSRVQSGQIAGAEEFLFADNIPATNVPCMHAMLLARAQLPRNRPGISRIFVPVSSGWLVATGPSIKAIFVSA